MSRRRPLRAAAVLAGVALCAGAWLALGPRQLGGSASYAVIVGSSMEPALHRGDLAVVRRRADYRVGDVVLFEDARLGGARILHRIVAEDGGRIRTKGDNNDYADDARLSEADLLGALSFRVPLAGGVVTWLHAPLHAAGLVALAALLTLGGGLGAGAARRRRRPQAARPSLPAGDVVLTAALGGAALSLLLATVAWKHPASHAEPVRNAYVQAGSFDYGTRVPRSAVYPDGRIHAGQPVFLRLAGRLRVSFRYRLETPQAHEVHGTAALDAVLADGRGWERRIPVAAARPFSGDEVVLGGSLDLRRLQAITADVQRLTGSDITTYTLRLRPAVALEGSIERRPLAVGFAPELAFLLDPVRLALDPAGADPASVLAPRRSGAGERRVADRISVGPLSMAVDDARVISLPALFLCLLAAAAVARARSVRGDEPDHARIAGRYGHLLVEAALPSLRDPGSVTELADVDGLARIAERSGRPIVHAELHGTDEYVVDDGGVVYRYRPGVRSVPEAWLAEQTAGASRA